MSVGTGCGLDDKVAGDGGTDEDEEFGFGSEMPRLLAQSSSRTVAVSYDCSER
jgi:hypothetical protein